MISTVLEYLVLICIIVLVSGAVYALDHRVKTKGNLFTGPASPALRIFAFALGLLFTGIFLLYSFDVELLILAVALIAYSLGASRFLQFIQRFDLGFKMSKKNLAFRQGYYVLSPEEITGIRNKVHRVIAEISYKDTVMIVVGFEDGTPQLLIGNGASLVGGKENFPERTQVYAQRLVRASQVFVDKIPLEKRRLFPQRHFVKFALVTEAGIHAVEESIKNLENEQAELHPLWVATSQLVELLVMFPRTREPSKITT